jgi:hypothetical protein
MLRLRLGMTGRQLPKQLKTCAPACQRKQHFKPEFHNCSLPICKSPFFSAHQHTPSVGGGRAGRHELHRSFRLLSAWPRLTWLKAAKPWPFANDDASAPVLEALHALVRFVAVHCRPTR